MFVDNLKLNTLMVVLYSCPVDSAFTLTCEGIIVVILNFEINDF